MSKQYCAKHVFHYSPNHIINVICPRREIDRLKAELNEAAERLGKVIQENGLLQNRVQNWPNLFDENMRLQTQLSEARAENGELEKQLSRSEELLSVAQAKFAAYQGGVEVEGFYSETYDNLTGDPCIALFDRLLLNQNQRVRVLVMKGEEE